ncbi:MAG TPA: PSD1 and planctomycete cytochrome C domain-containing protein [Planctomycetaceae bacterium]|nr:PSD1 and planctomycete cytochrome C domain-containing protein [Planctomycetaceae bacterium]
MQLPFDRSVGPSGPAVFAALAVAGALAFGGVARGEDRLRFNRDIRPILVDNCFRCHGPDMNERQADLRLDVRDVAVELSAIVPGKPAESELVSRIFSDDPDLRMPPADSHKQLSAGQKELLRRWIAEGAEYEGHWSYLSPVKPEIPAGANAIDHLVGERLKREGLQAAPEADRRTLARRLSFDLVGLPPKPEDVDAFVKDPSSDAYERFVERLLASPHYGERMAIGWLDVVRFGDTIGYHSDNPMNVWPYRDWVIRAFNQNKPFDEFTIEQLAGDLLPGSTQEQKVASAFNRLLLTTEEGGAQAKDYEARMLGDRVRAVGAVWLGQTLGCAQCHDHKYDPTTARDFYSMGAFFADLQEASIGRREPGMLVTDEAQAEDLARLRARVAELQQRFDAATPEIAAAQQTWETLVGRELAAAAQPAGGPNDPVRAPHVVLPPKEITEILTIVPSERSAGQQAKVTSHFRSMTPLLAGVRRELESAQKAVATYENGLPRCLVSVSMPNPRTVRILPRGNWLDESGPVVEPALPEYLAAVTAGGGRLQPVSTSAEEAAGGNHRLTRLDLAQWIVSRDQPLTARVVVNRLWKQFFGIGISRTVDDFGAQGEWPVHPELLDWLACEFMDSGWDVKHMVRTIVTSRTYRQASTGSKDLLARDPENRLLARQSRWRLEAELVRDNALAASGLLVPRIGGPSVKPYQPDGYWENLNFPVRTYDPSKGEDQYRRGLYTWWQRTFPHPSLLAFDAPSREECAADRPRSNIPQQALVLLNDPTYVEAARAFAARILKDGGADDASRLTWAWRQALQRPPRDDEREIVLAVLEKHRREYAEDPAAATQLLQVGFSPAPQNIDPVELAAWTSAARVILNLHETITRN